MRRPAGLLIQRAHWIEGHRRAGRDHDAAPPGLGPAVRHSRDDHRHSPRSVSTPGLHSARPTICDQAIPGIDLGSGFWVPAIVSSSGHSSGRERTRQSFREHQTSFERDADGILISGTGKRAILFFPEGCDAPLAVLRQRSRPDALRKNARLGFSGYPSDDGVHGPPTTKLADLRSPSDHPRPRKDPRS